MKNSFKKKLVRSRLKWASYVEKMGDEKLAKRADTQKAEGKGGKEHQDCDGKNALTLSLLRRPSKTTQPLVRADRPKPPSKLTVCGPFVYRDHILLLH